MEEWGNDRSVNDQIEAWEGELAGCEQQVSRIRARQVELIRCLDLSQIDTADGARDHGRLVKVLYSDPVPSSMTE